MVGQPPNSLDLCFLSVHLVAPRAGEIVDLIRRDVEDSFADWAAGKGIATIGLSGLLAEFDDDVKPDPTQEAR